MKDGIESLGRVRVQGLALLGLAFVVGVLTGMATERIRAKRFAEPPPLPVAWQPGGGMLPPGLRDLDLTPEQREEIGAILEARHPVTDSLVQLTMPRLVAIHDSVRAEIRAVLTPQQQQRFDAFERRRSRRGRAGAGGSRPGPGGPRRGPPPPF